MRFFAPSILGLTLAATAAVAECPSSAPIRIKSQSGDQSVTADWLQKNVAGRKVIFEDGSREDYKSNGTYAFKGGGSTYKADSYRFYKDGTRCIAYSNPRYDRYVVNNGQLVLINANGGRFVGKLAK